MTRDDLHASTLQRGAEPVPAPSLPRLTLTIVLHPSPRRIGERVDLVDLAAGSSVHLSRLAPDFSTPEGHRVGPLADPYLSRTPVILRGDDGVLTIDGDRDPARLRIVGATGPAPVRLGAAEQERGVLLVLADRVVVLLQAAPIAAADTPRYGLIGESAAIQRVRREIAALAGLQVPVLIRGESGTGKELVARALHAASPRAAHPFVVVNMAALPPQVAIAELFGHARGSFTGAVQARDGYFREAHGGTIFLDEIGDASLEVQVALLRALETGEIQALGGAAARRVDVRVLAATDADLEDGVFRSALYHRLAGYEIKLPPLRGRREDIAPILFHYLGAELTRAGHDALLRRLDDDATRLLPPAVLTDALTARWPGNVRELANAARRLVVALVTGGDPRAAITGHAAPRPDPAAPRPAPTTPPASVILQLSDGALISALEDHAWQITATARALGISRSALYARLRRCPELKTARELPAEELADLHRRHAGDLAAMSAETRISARALQLRMQALGLVE